MLLEAILGAKEAVSFGISLYETVEKARGILTGNTVTDRLERIEARLGDLNRVAEGLATTRLREVEHHGGPGAPAVDVTAPLVGAMRGVQRDLGVGLVHSQPVEAPAALLREFGENPERLLSHVSRLDGADLDPRLVDDPTMVPVVFERWGVRLVGWIKVGVLSLTLGTDYHARVAQRVAARGGEAADTSARDGAPGASDTPARDGHAEFLYRRAREFEARGVASEAATHFRQAAEQGHAEAQYHVASQHMTGRGAPKDAAEAARLFRLAAAQGHTRAQYFLGFMHMTGRGVVRDGVEAARHYRLAADQGNAKARANLAWMYQSGTGVARDPAEAVRLYRLAADQGNAMAQCNLGAMYAAGEGVARDVGEALRLFKAAADQGMTAADRMAADLLAKS